MRDPISGPDVAFQRAFDAEYYLSQLAESPLQEAVVERDDPAAHFLTIGWRLGFNPARWFDMLGYLVDNPEVAGSGLNPFLHFLEFGLQAGPEEGKRAMPFFQDRAWRHPDLQRLGRTEYGPVRHILEYSNAQAEGEAEAILPRFSGRITVHVHLFYPDMITAIVALLTHIPYDFELLVSVQDGGDEAWIAGQFSAALPRAQRVLVRGGPNRGRDVAPWLVSFRDELCQSDLFLHLHSKKSAHGSYHQGWFDFLGHSLLGSEAVAAQMLGLFAADADLGMVAPAYWPQLRRAPNYGKTHDLCAHLCQRMGLSAPDPICADFPAGSFFCCRSSLLQPLLNLELSFADFPAETGQICGTLAHAVERLLGILPRQAEQRFDMVAVDIPYEQARQQPQQLVPPPPGTGASQAALSVSVICVVSGWHETLATSLASVLRQQPPPQELLVVDASAEDQALAEIARRFGREIEAGRLRLTAISSDSLAEARNEALEQAQGDIIAYLEEEGLWNTGYLARLAVGFAEHPWAQSIYANLVRAEGQRSMLQAPGYRRAELLESPRLELAHFVHRRDVSDANLRFDAHLGKGAGWDFILRATASQAPLHLDFLGCALWAPDMSTSEHRAGPSREERRAVQVKHRNERLYWQQDSLQIALKVPAPKHEFKHRWGDLHLAESLAQALQGLGCRTRVDILPDWYGAEQPEDDVTLVFRGVTGYEPRPQHINLMWHISHPNRVSLEEMRRYDHVFISSYPYAKKVIAELGQQASVMMQCSDPDLFHTEVDLADVPRHDLLFVGNSRKTARWMPLACIERGLPVAIYGAEWEGLVPPQHVQGVHVSNDRLGAHYRASKIVLNDHWADMAAQGFVSNRIMDAGLAGAFVISDHFEGEELFMGHVVTCRSAQEVEEAARYYLTHDQARQDKAMALHRMVLTHHRVDLRARQVLQTVQGLLRDRYLRTRLSWS